MWEKLKNLGYGILIGLIIGGIFWYSFGRPDLVELRIRVDDLGKDIYAVVDNNSQLGDDFGGFAGDIASISATGTSLRDGVTDLNRTVESRFGPVRSDLIYIDGEVAKLEGWNRQAVILSRDLGDVIYELGRVIEEAGSEE